MKAKENNTAILTWHQIGKKSFKLDEKEELFGLEYEEDNFYSSCEEKNNLPGYLMYLSSDDIYNKYKEEKEIDPEDISKIKEQAEIGHLGINRKKDSDNDISDSDLDVPGSELDDKMEDIGSEDEENNYYSIGGDDHENLDEDKGE